MAIDAARRDKPAFEQRVCRQICVDEVNRTVGTCDRAAELAATYRSGKLRPGPFSLIPAHALDPAARVAARIRIALMCSTTSAARLHCHALSSIHHARRGFITDIEAHVA